MTTYADIGWGTFIEVETAAGSGVFFELGEVTGITPPNASIDQIEVTHMRSPLRTKEYVSGLGDPGEMSVDLNYVVGGATDDFILAWRADGSTRATRIRHPSADIDTFPSFITSYAPHIPVADKKSATLGLKVAGAVIRT